MERSGETRLLLIAGAGGGAMLEAGTETVSSAGRLLDGWASIAVAWGVELGTVALAPPYIYWLDDACSEAFAGVALSAGASGAAVAVSRVTAFPTQLSTLAR